jgi:hypothetical protein
MSEHRKRYGTVRLLLDGCFTWVAFSSEAFHQTSKKQAEQNM